MICKVCHQEVDDKAEEILHNVPEGAQCLVEQYEDNSIGVNLHILQCPYCQTVQLNDEPVRYYKEVITSVGYSKEMKNYREKQMREFAQQYNLYEKRVLEIGTGRGALLEIVENIIPKAMGIEWNIEYVQKLKAKGHDVEKGYIQEDYISNRGPLDAFFIVNFLEHAPNPSGILKGIHRNLVSEGVGLVEVPNFDKMIRTNRFYDFIRDHLIYFTKDTLRILLETNGFKVLDIYEAWKEDDLVAIVKKRESKEAKMLLNSKNNIKTILNNIINTRIAQNKKIAIWGASHQALTLLSMSQNHNISYVIDSAIFKQGRYTPILKIPIISPQQFRENPTDTIIIMAAGYSKEVMEQIKRMKIEVEIFILKGDSIERC